MTPHIGSILPTSQRRNYMAKQHGLSIKEQAIILENLCRHGDSCESCPCNFMQDVENCPFEWDCVLIKAEEWLPILEKRVPPEDQGDGA